VELGTHTGNSYCSFCQAIKELNIDAKCYAIDTWEGDAQAGYYGLEVLTDLKTHHDSLYGGFSQLIRSTFDDAVNNFEDRSIDLLHIDGLHTYEAVKHDFENWLPKLSNRAVVLFHDTDVHEGDFGVWKLWSELREKYPFFEFFHGYGLGVLAVGKNYPESFDLLLESPLDVSLIRVFFSQFGIRLQNELMLRTLRANLAEKEQAVQALTIQLAEKEQAVQALTIQLAKKEQAVQALTIQLAEIHGSRAWKYIQPLRRFRSWIMSH
jgi:O-antigen biosynthesis protein